MEPKDYKRACPDETCLLKDGTKTEIVPIIYTTTQFGEKEFQYPRFVCTKCVVEFIYPKLLTELIHAYTESPPLRKKMITTLRDKLKKAARDCGRKVTFIHILKKKKPQ
jgi:hypothetical protein